MSYESPFTTKLGTNYCPKDEEVAEINALLVEPTLRLERLADEIADMQKALDKLTTERDSLAAYVADHMTLLSPVRRLPLDIIQEIFVACIPTHRNCVMSASEAPVLLGRICSSWRAISLSTPRLWASLHVVEPERPFTADGASIFEQKLVQRLETTKTWLDRSGQCPLSISLEGCGSRAPGVIHTLPNPLPPPPTDLFLQVLIPFAPRWQHISFTAAASALSTLCNLPEAKVPILKSVALFARVQGPPGLTFEWGRLKMLRGPKISSFSVSMNVFPIELPLRWNQLTALSIDGITSHIALKIISSCAALRNFKVIVDDHVPAETPAHPIVELLFLHTLQLSCIGTTLTTAFTQFLNCMATGTGQLTK
ncbi:hypothetical protein C8R44DRAFT_881652 [Mycena epipterygia]|nr:hypothetical protein C8R44DRAFT_881652 [Mycena epipterygia]